MIDPVLAVLTQLWDILSFVMGLAWRLAPTALVGVGVWFLARRMPADRQALRDPDGTAARGPDGTAAPGPGGADPTAALRGPAAGAIARGWWARRAESAPMVGPLTWIVALVTAGALWVMGVNRSAPVGPGIIAAASLLVFGAGLIVSSVRGRARGLLLPVAALGVLVGGLSALNVRADNFGGPIVVTVRDSSHLQSEYAAAYGASVIDLTDLRLTSSRTVRIRVTSGSLEVRLPVTNRSVTTVQRGYAHVEVRSASGWSAAFGDPALQARWLRDGVPAVGSALSAEQLAAFRRGALPYGVRPLPVEASLRRGTTGPRLRIQIEVGVAELAVVDSRWLDVPKLTEPEQLCTEGGGPRGVVRRCSTVPAAQRVPLCINYSEHLVDCREDRPGTQESPRVPACQDGMGVSIDCAAVDIQPVGVELVSPETPPAPVTVTPPDTIAPLTTTTIAPLTPTTIAPLTPTTGGSVEPVTTTSQP